MDEEDAVVMTNESPSSSRGENGGSPGEWVTESNDSMSSNGWEEEVVVTVQGTSGSSSTSACGSEDHELDVVAEPGARDCKGQGHQNLENASIKTRESDLLGSAMEPISLDGVNIVDEGSETDRDSSFERMEEGGERGRADDAASDVSACAQEDEMEGKDETLQQEIHERSPRRCSRHAVVANGVEGTVTSAPSTDRSTRVSEQGGDQRSTDDVAGSSGPTPGLLEDVEAKDKGASLDVQRRCVSPEPESERDAEAAKAVAPTPETKDSGDSLGRKNDDLVTDGMSMEGVVTSDPQESLQDDASMTDAMIIDEAEENESSPQVDAPALLDLDLLLSMLKRTQDAGDALDGQDVVLFIGATGSGKTTTVLYFAGASFEEDDSTGFSHYIPIEFPSENLKEFEVGPGGRSITQTIFATRTQLSDGTEIVLVDTPGFGDTNGAEHDIANGLGLIRALQRAKSIRPVLVFNVQLFGDRFRSLSETLDTVHRMTGGERSGVEFAKFKYLYTRCEGSEIKRIQRKLSTFINTLLEQEDISTKNQLLPLLEDMRRQATPTALTFDPLDSEKRSELLLELWSDENGCNALKPSDFFPFLSLGVKEKLQGELERRLALLECDCRVGNFHLVQENLVLLRRLSMVLPEAADAANRALSSFASSLSSLHQATLHQFKNVWLFDLNSRVELRNALNEIKNEVDKLLRVPEETLSLLPASVPKQAVTVTELFHEVLRSCPRIEASLSSNDIHAARKTLFLLSEVCKYMGEVSGGKTFSTAFLQAFDRTLAHATSGLRDVEVRLAANTIEELLEIQSPMSFAVDLMSFLNAEAIAVNEGRAVLDRKLSEVIKAMQSRMNRSIEQVRALSRRLTSSFAEEIAFGRDTVAEVAKVSGSRTFIVALCRMTDLEALLSAKVDPSAVNVLDKLVISTLSGIPDIANKKIQQLEHLLAKSIPFDFEEQRRPLILCAEAVNGALSLGEEILLWPCIDLPRKVWEQLTIAKSSLCDSLKKLDEFAKLIERGFAEAVDRATRLSQRFDSTDVDASASYIELFNHWEAWEALLATMNKSKSWVSSIKGLLGMNPGTKNSLDVLMKSILRRVNWLFKGSVHRLLALRDSDPVLLLQEYPKDVCFILAFFQTPKALSLGPQVLSSNWDSRGELRQSTADTFRMIVESIDKINRLPSTFLSDHKYDRIDLFIRRMEESKHWVRAFRTLASRIVYSHCIVKEFVTEYEFETLNKSLFDVPTSQRVIEDVEQAANGLSSKVEQLSLLSALQLTADHERMKFFQDVVDLLSACSTVGAMSGHFKTGSSAASLYQNLLQRIDSDLQRFRDGLLSITASFPDDAGSLAQINSHLSSLASFEQCFADVKPLLANMASRISIDCRAAVFLSLEQRSTTSLKSDCDAFASYLVVLKKSSREVPFWKCEIDNFIDKTLKNRVAHADQPESFLLDLSIALKRIDGDDAVIAEQLLWDHRKFQGVLTSIFSEATAGQDITYVLNGLHLSPEQRQKLETLYSSFLDLYTNKVLDGVAAFRSGGESLPEFLSNLVAEALRASTEGDLGFSESTVLLSSSLFAHWSLSNLSDLVLIENHGSSLSKYVMRPHAAQVVACWIMLNVHDADEFHSLKHHLVQLGTGEGKSIILGVVATILAVWGYSVDVLCYSSYLSQRDFNAFKTMFSDFGVSGYIWYGTLRGLTPRIMGSDYFENARAEIKGSMKTKRQHFPFRPSVLLVDEVDVFFGADVFGCTSCRLCKFSSNSLVSLLTAIWQRSVAEVPRESILNSPEVRQCLSELPTALHPHFIRSIPRMQDDAETVRRDASLRYHVVEDQIAYKYFDGVETNYYHHGYQTHFHYIKEWDCENISEASMKSNVHLLCRVTLTSYAEFPFAFDVTLGITGTLSALTSEERNVLEDMYGIRSHSYIPSVFGRNKLAFAGDQETDFKLCDSHGDHVFELKHELISRRESFVESQKVLRPVMIFFDSKGALLKFHSSTLMEPLKEQVAVVTEATPPYEKDSLFLKATEAGAITLMLREFGRGTDFKCFDRRVLEAGGVHVIQAFFSSDLAEEIQIKGRCARQGAAGSFSMVLNIEDLQRDFGVSKTETETMRRRRELYSYVNEKRAAVHASDLNVRMEKVAAAEKMHYRTLACKEALESGREAASGEIISFFNELNGLGDSRSFTQTGLKEAMIARRRQQFEKFKAEDRKKRSKARETLLLEASIADKKRLETRERLKADNVTHYLVLGISQDASAEDEKRAFRELSVLFHPDKCKDDDATEIFRKVQEAHDVLSCAAKRAAYDAEIA